MKQHKLSRKFPVGSLIYFKPGNFWWESYNTVKETASYGMIIYSDHLCLYVLINSEIAEVDWVDIKKIKVVQRPYSKFM